MPTDVLDERDQATRDARLASLDAVDAPRCGDFVDFTDGTLRRISYIWPEGCQTTDASSGHYYLGDGYVSMSGGLCPCVPTRSLEHTDETRDGAVWFFHHDWWTAGGGVDFVVPFRVYRCALEPPR